MTALDEHGTTWWQWDGTTEGADTHEPYLRTLTGRPVQPNVVRRCYSDGHATILVRNTTPPGDEWTPADPADTDAYPLRRTG